MVNIGRESAKVANKGPAQVSAALKTHAAEFIPCGDELASVISESVFTLKEWMSFVFESADICLEKEMQWPVE